MRLHWPFFHYLSALFLCSNAQSYTCNLKLNYDDVLPWASLGKIGSKPMPCITQLVLKKGLHNTLKTVPIHKYVWVFSFI